MATEEIALKITTDASQTEKSVKSIRQELREAQQNAVNLSRQFGELSPEALAAAKKVANLKDEVGDLKDRVDALNPDAKFRAFSSALQGVAGGFAGVQGAIGLFGTESAELEKQLLKVQSALALSEGLNSVIASKDAFKNLGAIVKGNVTKAFGTLRGAIISTGIGALVVGVGLLIANFETVKKVVLNFIPGLAKVGEFIGKLVDGITDFVGVTSEASRAYDKLAKSTKSGNEDIDRRIALLKAQGGQENKVAELETQKVNNSIKVLQAKSKAEKGLNADDLKNYKDLQNQKGVIAAEEQSRLNQEAKDRKKQRQEENKQAAAEAKQKADEVKKQIYESDKELTLARLEGREKEKKQLEIEEKEALKAVEGNAKATQNIKDLYVIKGQELNKQFAEEDKKTAQEVEDFKNELYLDSITNAKLRDEEESKLALAKKIQEIDESKLSAVEKAQATQDAINAWQFEQDAKDFEAQLAKDAAAIAKTEGDFANDLAILDTQRQAIVNNTKLTEEERTKLLDENSKARRSIEDAESEHKKKQVGETIKLLGDLGSILGQQTAAGKALGIATALINTYQGATEALKEKSTLPQPFSTIARFASAAAIIANGIRTVKQITSVKVPGGAGGGGQGASNPISGGVTATQAPIASGIQVTNTQSLGTTDVNVQNQGAVKAFVVERDITDSQDRIAKIKAAATI
jgi:hypothetical protein